MQEDRVTDATRILEDFLVAKYSQVMHTWPADLISDIYTLSLYRDDNNVPYRPSLYLLYNTRSHLAEPRTAELSEAKWNLALWVPIQRSLGWVGIDTVSGQHGNPIEDREGRQALDDWLSAVTNGRSADDEYETVVRAFSTVACRVGRRLHDSGEIRAIFDWDVPIIMHDDEWDEAIMVNTVAANPPGVADEFLNTEAF